MSFNNKNIASKMLSGKWFPILLLIIMVFAYAVQVPGLGYYLDDWIYVASFDQGGEEALLSYGINVERIAHNFADICAFAFYCNNIVFIHIKNSLLLLFVFDSTMYGRK